MKAILLAPLVKQPDVGEPGILSALSGGRISEGHDRVWLNMLAKRNTHPKVENIINNK